MSEQMLPSPSRKGSNPEKILISEEMPPSPFRKRPNPEKILISEEIRAILGIYELTRRLRAKDPEDSEDVDKSKEDISESVGDHTAMSAYLMHYFLPILESAGMKLDYGKTLDMVLAHGIGDINNPSKPGVQKTPEERRQELVTTAKVFGELPRRGGFNRQMFEAYTEYLGQETSESRFVRAVNGLETMLYVLSRPAHLRAGLVGGKGYAVEDYRDRIQSYCREFPQLLEFYKRLEPIFHWKDPKTKENYFAPSREYENQIPRPDVLQNVFLSNAPDFGDPTDIDVESENARLLELYRMKRQLLFGQEPKPSTEYHDTDAEHIASALFLNRYFTPAILADQEQQGRDELSLRETTEILLAHDVPEAITGEKIVQAKTAADTVEEKIAAATIANRYAPRAGGFNQKFMFSFAKYELGKSDSPAPLNAKVAKAIDTMEGQFNLLYLKTRETPARMIYMSHEKVDEKSGRFIRMFPIIDDHFEALNEKFKEVGLF